MTSCSNGNKLLQGVGIWKKGTRRYDSPRLERKGGTKHYRIFRGLHIVAALLECVNRVPHMLGKLWRWL